MTLALACLLSLTAAQEADIVVTGRGLDQGRGEVAFALVEIDRDRLSASASSRLEEVLRDVPGFQLFRPSDSASASPTSQGATLRALGGNASSRALLLLDGVPQGDPFGGWVSWPAFDPRRLAAVRVTRGGGTGADGPGALAGTIALESTGPAELSGLDARLAYGSRNAIDAHAALGGRLGDGHAFLSTTFSRGDGFVPVVAGQRGPADRPAPYGQASIAARAAFPAGRDLEVQASLGAFADARERGTAFSEIDASGADAALRMVGNGRLPFAVLAYAQIRRLRHGFAALDSSRTTAAPAAEQYNVPATGLGARAEIRPAVGAVELRLGGDWRETSGESRERFMFIDGTATRGRVAGGRTRTAGLFAQAGWEGEALSTTAGVRLDRWWIEAGRLGERVLATGAVLTDLRPPDRTGWEPTARAGVAWRAAPGFSIRSAAYLGWRLPTLNELHRPFRVGPDATAANPALAPERLRGIEAGIDYRPAPWARIAVTAFDNRLSDAIANVTLGQGPGTFPGVGFVAGVYRQRRNIDAIRSRGVEIDGRVQWDAFSLTAGYAYADARVRARGAAAALDALRPAQTPRHALSAVLAWSRPDAARASLAVRHMAGRYEDDLNRQRLPAATTLDAALAWPIAPGLALEARAENIADALVVAGMSGAGIVERATPRTVWIGFNWRR